MEKAPAHQAPSSIQLLLFLLNNQEYELELLTM